MPHKGYKQKAEVIAAAAARRTGTKQSEETKAKKSLALKGRPQPEGLVQRVHEARVSSGATSRVGDKKVRWSGSSGNRPSVWIKVEDRWDGWKAEHRWIFEQELGRPLLKNEHVHHIDGNPLNNDRENLALISPIEHALITKLLICLSDETAKIVISTLNKRFNTQ